MQGNHGDFCLLVVNSQIGNLILDPSFGHTLCFKYPNGSCDPILDAYVPRDFQWYKNFFNPMIFDPCNHSLKIWESTGILTPKVGAHLRVWRFIPSHSPTLPYAWNVIPGLHSWPAPLQVFVLVMSPRLGMQHFLTNSKLWIMVISTSFNYFGKIWNKSWNMLMTCHKKMKAWTTMVYALSIVKANIFAITWVTLINFMVSLKSPCCTSKS
jgi:hypothetical protein